jgi:hypothetical protein
MIFRLYVSLTCTGATRLGTRPQKGVRKGGAGDFALLSVLRPALRKGFPQGHPGFVF